MKKTIKVTLRGIVLISILSILPLISGCMWIPSPTGEYRETNIRIFRDTPAWNLARAVRNQNTRQILRIAENNPELLDYRDPLRGMTLLHWAIGNERYNSARALLEAGADPNIIADRSGQTPLFMAAGFSFIDRSVNRDPRFVRLLLQHGADPNIGFAGSEFSNVNEIGTTPLMRSVGAGIEKTRLLIEYGADINTRLESGRTAAIRALMHGGSAASMLIRLEYAHFLIVEMQADVTGSFRGMWAGEILDSVHYPITLLQRNWRFPEGDERHRVKMEIVEEFARQGINY